MITRRTYDPEFKRMTVDLMNSGKTSTQIGFDLGVAPDLVRRWKREYNSNNGLCFTGQGNINLSPEQLELEKLKKELHEVKIERDILKKAVCIFSKNDGKSFHS